MNVLFLINEPIRDFSGIANKILYQVKSLKNLGENVFLSYIEEKENYKFTGRYVEGTLLDKYSNIAFIAKFERRCLYKNLLKFIIAHDIKLVYIRYIHFANPFFNSFLKKIKSYNIPIFLELPTYPYDQEYKNVSFARRLAFLIERIYRKQFKKYVTRIITLSNDKSIFQIPTIQISNGIDAHAIKIREVRVWDTCINLIGVATISFWHGFDRVIEGLKHYYNEEKAANKKVFFHIVGDSSNNEALRYKHLVEQYKLNDYVIFHGKKSGEELDNIFNNMDVAVGSLGCHRISIEHIKSLKNREYCARGVPFFYSQTDPDFENEEFIYKVPSNDAPVDIDAVVEFVNKQKCDAATIRNYALENLTWEKQFKKILAEAYLLKNSEQPINKSRKLIRI
jgi:hypothetical protein